MRLGRHTNTLTFSSETHRLENALERSKQKRIRIALVWTVEKGRECIKMKTITGNIAGACLCSMRKELNLSLNVQFHCFERFSVESRKHIKTVVWTRTHRCDFDDNENAYYTFENALVWTRPKTVVLSDVPVAVAVVM